MSDVRLVIRDLGSDWSGTIHGSSADRAIAALSADPVTLEELETAVSRFEKTTPYGRFFGNLSPGLCDEPYDAGLVVIDLDARLVVVDTSYSSPGPTGYIHYHDGTCCTDTVFRYHLADDWLFAHDGNNWRGLAEDRRRERAARPLVDVRAVFYDRPLIEFIARETFAAFAHRDKVDSNSLTVTSYETPTSLAIKDIHAAWLLTPREDLGNACPREVALERRDHLTWDLQDRSEQWSIQETCPRGLDESSFAFRQAGFGTHELVKYYDLVRELLWSCWERLTELEQSPQESLRPGVFTAGDFLVNEIPRLEQVRDEWFESPDPECHGRTPRSIIDRERARLPEGISGHEAMVDPDCPCCQMMADMPGPAFWHLDGSEMDDDFAFDIYHRTRADWDDNERQMNELHARFNAEQKEYERLGLHEESPSFWSSSFIEGDISEVPPSARMYALGCRLAEIITDLRGTADHESTPRDVQQLIDQLNRDFGNLREVIKTSETSYLGVLISRFADTLAEVTGLRADLSEKCSSLSNDLATFLYATDSDESP